MIDLLAALAGGLALAGALMIVLLVVRRLWVARLERERRRREVTAKPLALALLEGDEVGGLGALDAGDRDALAMVLVRYGRVVSGEARGRIADFCERQGLVDGALDDLGNRRPWRRASAAFALGDMASPRVAPALVDALSDDRREVRSAAVRSLGRLRVERAAEPLALALADESVPSAVVARAILDLGSQAAPRLRNLRGHEDASVRAAAAELLGLVGEGTDAGTFIELLRDPAAEVRARAAQALGRIGADDAVRELRSALADRMPFVRTNAAHALGATGDAEAVPLLLAQTSDDLYDPAHAAAQALMKLAPLALEQAARDRGASDHILEAADLVALRGSPDA